MDRNGRDIKEEIPGSKRSIYIHWPTPGFTWRTFELCVLTRSDFNFCVHSSLLLESRGKGAAIFDLGSLSLAFLYWVVCVFSLGTFTEVSLVKPEDSLSPLFSAIHYSKSWVWKLVDSIWPTHRLRYGNLYVVPDQSIGYAMEACKQCLTKA